MSVKSLDREGRWRDTTVGFRVSEEENERINQLAALSGMTKQAFIINRLVSQAPSQAPASRSPASS